MNHKYVTCDMRVLALQNCQLEGFGLYEQLLAVLYLALGDRPGAGVLALEVGPARMAQEHLDAGLAPPVEEDAGAHT